MRDAPPSPKAPIKGIVVVHGVGTARQSSALMYIGRPLLNWVQRWMNMNYPDALVRFEDAGLSFRRTDNDATRPPSHVTLRVEGAKRDLHWVVAEVWWSTDSRSPDTIQIALWLLKYLLKVISSLDAGVRQWIDQLIRWGTKRGAPGALDKWWQQLFYKSIDLCNAVVQFLLFLLLVIVGFLLAPILILLTAVPIRPVQQFVLVNLLRTWVTANVGEMYTLLEDEIQASNLRGRLEQSIQWLVRERGCEEIYVIAHSGGAVVGLETLCWGADHPEIAQRVTKFLTVGAGLNKAWVFNNLQGRKIRGTPAGAVLDKGKLLKPDQWRLGHGFTAGIRWVDFWSAYDPVPAGSLKTRNLYKRLTDSGGDARTLMHGATRVEPEEVITINWMSMLSDHTGYWTNEEQLLSRLAQEIDESGPDYTASRFWPGKKGTFKRQYALATARMHRITIRAGTRLVTVLLAIVAFVRHWQNMPDWIGTLWHKIATTPVISGIFGGVDALISSFPTPLRNFMFEAVGAVGVVIVFVVLYQPARVILNLWDKHEYQEALRRTDGDGVGVEAVPPTVMGQPDPTRRRLRLIPRWRHVIWRRRHGVSWLASVALLWGLGTYAGGIVALFTPIVAGGVPALVLIPSLISARVRRKYKYKRVLHNRQEMRQRRLRSPLNS